MALNWTMLDAQRNPVPLPHETTIWYLDHGAELTLTIPDAPPSVSSTSGGSGGTRQLRDVGRLLLTDQRLVFISPPKNDGLDSLTVPLFSIHSTSYEQPLLGANYLKFDIKPAPDGGLSDGTRAEVRFKDQAMFQFVSLLEKSRERAIYMKRQAESEADTLPVYETPIERGGRTPVPETEASGSNTEDVPREYPPGYTQ